MTPSFTWHTSALWDDGELEIIASLRGIEILVNGSRLVVLDLHLPHTQLNIFSDNDPEFPVAHVKWLEDQVSFETKYGPHVTSQTSRDTIIVWPERESG